MKRFMLKRSFSINVKEISLPESVRYHNCLHYRKNQENPKKKLAVVIGWLGGKDSQLKSYLSFYHSRGFDTLSFAVGPGHVIYPHDAMKHMQDVWDTALVLSPNAHILVHSFSMGGYLFGQSLRCFEKYPEKYGNLTTQIRAQIFDSPPDHGSIANGLSKSFNLPRPLEKPIELLARGYLSWTYDTAGVEHRAASRYFHNNYIKAPGIFFYSLSDPISRYQDCEQVMKTWKENGISVEGCRWDNSPHIQHGRRDPERYFGEIEKLLIKTQLHETNTSPIDTTTSATATATAATAKTTATTTTTREEKITVQESEESESENEKKKISM